MDGLNGSNAFTLAVFDGTDRRTADYTCLACGRTALRIVRLLDCSIDNPLEIRLCAQCWGAKTSAGDICNPLAGCSPSTGNGKQITVPQFHITELPLTEALERLYLICADLRGGLILIPDGEDVPLVGPLKIRPQSLANALDSLLGPVSLQWDICNDFVIIAPDAEALEQLRRLQLNGGEL